MNFGINILLSVCNSIEICKMVINFGTFCIHGFQLLRSGFHLIVDVCDWKTTAIETTKISISAPYLDIVKIWAKFIFPNEVKRLLVLGRILCKTSIS